MRLLDVQSARTILEKGSCRCHLIGVAGSGMRGLAFLLMARGHQVSGSDLKKDAPLARCLSAFHQTHEARHVEGADLVVFSSAVSEDNAERKAAFEKGIPQARRAEVLAAVCAGKKLLLVAGTHGKSTSAAMLAHILQTAGRAPSYYIGAEAPILGSCAAWSKDGEEMVLEADESDGSLSAFSPDSVLLLNVEPEHMDHFCHVDDLKKTFADLANRAASRLVFCQDNPLAREVAAKRKSGLTAFSYGFDEKAEYRIEKMQLKEKESFFDIMRQGKKLAEIHLHVPGRHNVSNAAGVFALGDQLGAPVEKIREALESFRAVKRRFDTLFDNGDYIVVDDYAHHPTEIQATLAAAKGLGKKRVIAVFQPHRYSRTLRLKKEFADAFNDADQVLLTEIYAASEKPIEGVSGESLAREIKKQPCSFHPSLGDLRAAASSALQVGDLLLVMGAGNVEEVGKRIAEDLKMFEEVRRVAGAASVVQPFEPMNKRTTLRIGGPAQIWCEPADEEALTKVLIYCREQEIPVTVIGRGTNLLVKDHGIRGVCIHLSQPFFCRIEIQNDKMRVGCGVLLRQIVAEAKKAGIGGLEFMEGIPGTLGGALRMNAGIKESCTFERVESVRCMDLSGQIHTVAADKIETHYRDVPLFKENVALEAVLKGQPTPSEKIAEKLKELSQKRWASQPAAPSAGCIFRNPADIPAGKLIDELGLKNTARGGVKISPVHGNFIINEGGAKASDALELIEWVQQTAWRERGIQLQPEVKILGE
ncbi:MAG: UDP-N-acetylmuramate--L-alanine ligase [bacterium]